MPDQPDPATPALSAAAVRKVARLARLELTDEEVERERTRLSAVLGYMERLRELDLADVEPMATPLDATQPLRPDDPGPTLPTSILMDMAPDTMDPFIKVPKVLGEGS